MIPVINLATGGNQSKRGECGCVTQVVIYSVAILSTGHIIHSMWKTNSRDNVVAET